MSNRWSACHHTAARAGALGLAWALAGLPACTLGGKDDGDSPYDHAGITAPTGPGVADGVTTVGIEITGRVGARLTLQVSDGARFVQPDANQTAEKTVFLEDDGTGAGKDTVQVFTGQPGSVRIFFKVDPLYDPEIIEFLPVRLAAGPAEPVGYLPGLLVQEACVAVNTARGALTTAGYVPPQGTSVDAGENVDADFGEWFKSAGDAYPISATPPAGLTCPSDGADALGWVGFARVEYTSAAAEEELSLTYRTAEQVALATEDVPVSGAAFPGYEITAVTDPAEPGMTDSFAYVILELAYQPVGELEGAIAKGVSLSQRFVPEPGPSLLGSSAGGAEDPIATSADGHVTLFFSLEESGTWAWFVTPAGGQPTQLADLIIYTDGYYGDGDGDGDW